LSAHCQRKRSGGVPRWIQRMRWTSSTMRCLHCCRSSAGQPRSSNAPWRRTLRRISFIRAVLDELCVSGMTDFGTTPCLATSATNMFHCPPSPATSETRNATVRSSRSLSAVSIIASRK